MMENECEGVKEWGNGRFLQVREKEVNGFERERELGLKHVRLLKRILEPLVELGSSFLLTLKRAPLKVNCSFLI